jgi:DNA-binding transcriptional ArsR family regulator
MPADPRVVHLDSAQLRVLAHPLRARLLGALRVYGPATSTGLAQRLGTNSGATSYHLRQLAQVGLVAEDEGRGTQRERWWRAAHDVTSWVETEFLDDPDDRAAADWLVGNYSRARSRWVSDWLAARDQWPREWRAAADSSDFGLQLSAQQLSALNAELHEVVDRYRGAGVEPGGAVQRVIVLLDTFPSPEPRV